jgi:VWFA-related protein
VSRLIAAALIVTACGLAAQQRFTSGVGIVTMNVGVRHNGAPVTGLTAKDFRLTDGGIDQRFEVSLAASRPADITLLIDTSGSMAGTMDEMRAHVRAVANQLGSDDRLRLITFADDVREVFGFRPGRGPLPLESLQAGGWTAMYDALGLAFIHQPAADRGHLIVVFSDAIDSSSTIDLKMLSAMTRRSDAILHAFVEHPRGDVSRRIMPSRDQPPPPPIGAVADLTGGYATFMGADDDVPGAFRQALAEFRRRYVLTYAMPEPIRKGWHEVSVSIQREGIYEVKTRRGYVQ